MNDFSRFERKASFFAFAIRPYLRDCFPLPFASRFVCALLVVSVRSLYRAAMRVKYASAGTDFLECMDNVLGTSGELAAGVTPESQRL